MRVAMVADRKSIVEERGRDVLGSRRTTVRASKSSEHWKSQYLHTLGTERVISESDISYIQQGGNGSRFFASRMQTPPMRIVDSARCPPRGRNLLIMRSF
jgi:hypothetical protein